jgi:hypothetical protein
VFAGEEEFVILLPRTSTLPLQIAESIRQPLPVHDSGSPVYRQHWCGAT